MTTKPRAFTTRKPYAACGRISYSQGLEWAIECGDVKDLESAKTWIGDILHAYQAHFELPVLRRLYQSWQSQDMAAVSEWDAFYKAGRGIDQSVYSITTGSQIVVDDFAQNAGLQGAWTLHEDQVSSVPVPAALPLMASALGLFGFGSMRR